MTQPAPLAVQLWTFNDLAAVDFAAVLRGIAALGYGGIETHRLHDWDPAALRAEIEDAGLTLTSAHGRFRTGAEADELLREKAALGADLMVSGLENHELESLDALREAAGRINENVARAADLGLRVGLHNHEREFTTRFGDQLAYDVLLELIDPSVALEIDLYWVAVAGLDPAEVIAKYGERVELIHVKDGPATAFEDFMVPVGEGTVDIDSAVAAARHARWHIVELDRSRMDPYESIARSRDYLVSRGWSRVNGP